MTKDGSIAGPKVLEHMVDTVLYFEGDSGHAYRIIRGIKNRFGPTNEIGVFEMRDKGLSEVVNPSAFFLSERPQDAPGSVVVASLEGTRPILSKFRRCEPLTWEQAHAIALITTCVALVAVLYKVCGYSWAVRYLFINWRPG